MVSEAFSVSNGVRRGGVLHLLYLLDELSEHCGVGCV